MVENIWQIVEYSAGGLGVLGAILIALRIRSGYIIWLVNNTLWVLFGLHYEKYGLAGQFIVYWFITIVGWFYWNRDLTNKK